jgi:hypothetical protein
MIEKQSPGFYLSTASIKKKRDEHSPKVSGGDPDMGGSSHSLITWKTGNAIDRAHTKNKDLSNLSQSSKRRSTTPHLPPFHPVTQSLDQAWEVVLTIAGDGRTPAPLVGDTIAVGL